MNIPAVVNKWQKFRAVNESSISTSQDDQRNQMHVERHRLLSSKVERCVQELVERIFKQNSSLNFQLLAPPSSHLSNYSINENKEHYFDFYIVWKNLGNIQIERDLSSICCKIKYLERLIKWSRAEQERLLIKNINKKKFVYLNGRGLRDLVFETLHNISPDLIRLDFIEHLIYFDLIIPSVGEKTTCHVTLLPCIHLPDKNEVLLPFGTLRWYPRSLLSPNENFLFHSLQQPLQFMPIRRYISQTDVIDETMKITRKDQQDFARARAIVHELLLPCTLEHVDSIEQLRIPFENEDNGIKKSLFLPHKSDRNCNVFPAGQYLLNDTKAKRFFREFLRTNTKRENEEQIENTEVKEENL